MPSNESTAIPLIKPITGKQPKHPGPPPKMAWLVWLSYAIGGGTLPKLLESVILVIGPNVLAAPFDENTSGGKPPLLSSTNTATFGTPWLRLTPVGSMMCLESIGGVQVPVKAFELNGFMSS